MIVVDNGSRGRNRLHLALGFREMLRLRVLSRKGVPASALAIWAEAAAGHSLGFLDADCIAVRICARDASASHGLMRRDRSVLHDPGWLRGGGQDMRPKGRPVPLGAPCSSAAKRSLPWIDEAIADGSEDCEFSARAAAATAGRGIPFLSVVHRTP